LSNSLDVGRALDRTLTGFLQRPKELEHAIAGIEAGRGPVEILIYNVRGMTPPCAPLDMTYEQLDRSFALEAIGAFAAARAVLPAMIRRGHGTLIFSSATAAFRGSATHPLYSIAKFAVRGLAQSLAKAYASSGVHVAHARIDGALDVPLMRALAPEDARAGRLASPDAVAEAYWSIHCQPAAAWSNEVELRPSTEPWRIDEE
jgi:NAD(P)-dependent dehydrogenase (short-subunit alcohol dehydrogenase family)